MFPPPEIVIFESKNMGGSAYLIGVTPDYQNVIRPFLDREKSKNLSFFGRFLGHRKNSFESFADIPCQDLGRIIASDFYDWVKKRIPSPTPATAAFMKEYLFPILANVFLRGERPDPEKPEEFARWYVQITFSGCAGMGEVSSMVASHWVEVWYRENYDRVNQQILAPFNLSPATSQAEQAGYGPFFEFADRGMALYYPKGTEVEFFIGESEIRLNFELDVATDEMIHEEKDLNKFHQQVQQTQASLPEALEKGECLCQMCRTQ